MTQQTTAVPAVLPAEVIQQTDHPALIKFKRFLRHRSSQVGLLLLGILLVFAVFANQIAPYDPIVPLKNVQRRDTPCIHIFGCAADKAQHLMGIDGNSRDQFSRIVFGARLSLQIGISTVSFAILVGGLLGALAGFLGGWMDD